MSTKLTLLLLAACASDPKPDPDPTPDTDIVLRVQTTIQPGTEVEQCMFAKMPDSYLTRDEIGFTAGSHHVLVFQTSYTEIPTHKDDGTPVDTSGVFDCTDGATNGWSVTKLIGGSQNGDGESVMSFPPGVAIHAGGVVLVNVHYINPLDTPLSPDVNIRFHTLPAEDVVEEGDILFLYNPLIGVPAGGTGRAHWRCPVYRDITIANVQSHMHARGVGYAAAVDDAPPFYVNDRWEGVPVQHYDNLVVPAGAHLDYFCDYRNTTGRSIYQGPRTTDEMCMLIGSYYPADPRTAACLDPTGKLPGGDWIGSGTKTCAETMTCLQGATDLRGFTDCMAQAAPSASHTSSELARCLFTAHDPGTECGTQIQACSGS